MSKHTKGLREDPRRLLKQIPREKNSKVDELSWMASNLTHWTNEDPIVEVQFIAHTSNTSLESAELIVHPVDQRYDILLFLQQGRLPADGAQAQKIHRMAVCFILINGTLYERAFGRPLWQCLGEEEVEYVLREIYEGYCGIHMGYRAFTRKASQQTIINPPRRKMQLDGAACTSCQRHQNLSAQLVELMKTMTAPCPFNQLGINIVGLFPLDPSQKQFLLVAVDYFSKWIEAKPMAWIIEEAVMNFLWKNIVYHFGISRRLVSDNER